MKKNKIPQKVLVYLKMLATKLSLPKVILRFDPITFLQQGYILGSKPQAFLIDHSCFSPHLTSLRCCSLPDLSNYLGEYNIA